MGSYFNHTIYEADIKKVDIDTILREKMTLVSGDFWGIQKFIFERLSTKNASKVLRAKSAFIQIFTQYVALYICKKLEIDKKYILSINAGKFEILVPQENINLKEFEESLDCYFKENFYGLSGMSICATLCQKDDFTSTHRYRKLRDNIAKEVEKSKFHKFNLSSISSIMHYDTNIDNNSLCKVCNIRKINITHCDICTHFIELGWKLTKKERDSVKIDYLDKSMPIYIELNKQIKSYIPKKEDRNEPLDFGDIANKSCKALDTGIKALGVLKADVDSMGKFIKDEGVIDSFDNFDSFSKGLDGFFSLYIVDRLKSDYRNIYTVFTGGDDLFLIGAWDEILEFAREIRNDFIAYTHNKLTISFGIVIAKPSTPISYLAEYSEALLEEAKGIDEEKDAISFFKETVKWESYLKVHHQLEEVFKNFEVVGMGTLYRLLALCDMSKNIDKDMKNSMWKSKLNYLFLRNIDKKYHSILSDLNRAIEKNPKETKIFLSEFIYKRRDV